MKKDTFLYFQDDNNLYLFWQKDASIIKREIVGIDEMFNSKVIATTNETNLTLSKKDVKRFFEIRVNSYDKENHLIEGTLIDNKNKLDKITISCLKSYRGLTLSFDTHFNIYDRYDLYEIDKNNKKIIVTSEDFQINSTKIKEGKEYYVEAFTKEKDTYILKATSDIYKCHINKIKHSMNKPKISIIIPAYNTDFFLPRTIDSVLFSTLKDLEVIIIDDGSTDKGPKIIDWYSEKYKGIIQGYHQNNQGLSYARNNGTKYATGEFIAYLDSDDIVHQYMYEELYTSAIEDNSPIAIGKTLTRDKINEHSYVLNVPNPNNDKYRSYTYEEMLKEKNHNTCDNIFFVAVWNKIIRADIAKAHKFSKSNYYEDTAYTRMIYSYLDKFTFVFNAWYIWDKRRRKTTGSYSTTGYKDAWRSLHTKYINSLLYCTRKGNLKKIDLILCELLYEIRFQMSLANGKETGLYKLYKKSLIELNEKFNFLQYKVINEDPKLQEFLKDSLT